MSKRIQVVLTEKALQELEKIYNQASADFTVGTITLSDVVTEMVLTSNIDIKELRLKHTNVSKYLKNLASDKNVDVEMAVKNLLELKSQLAKKSPKTQKMNDGIES